MLRVEIKHRWTGSVLYGCDVEADAENPLREVVVKAVKDRANLGGANLVGANLPAPTVVLLAWWGVVGDDLCADLTLLDASAHPDPEAFDRWAKGGPCPYQDVKVARVVHFQERPELWGKGQMCRLYDLMMRLLAEKCPEWPEEERAAFDAKFRQ